MTGADTLCRALEERGITCVFGLPGTQSVGLHEALRRSRIRVVLPTHELAAGFMANGYYRASGRIAPLVTIPGPGFMYALPGMAEALHDSAAILHITGGTRSADPRRDFQALDQIAIAGPLVKGTRRIEAPAQIHAAVADSLALALGGEPGPVLLEWAPEALSAPAGSAALPVRTAPSVDVDREAVERVAELLASARRPLLLAGQGCAGASEALRELAELVSAAVMTTTSGRGVLAEDHPLALGFDLARSGPDTANELFGAADLTLVVGCKLGASGTAGFRFDIPRERLVRVDADPAALDGRYAGHIGIVASAERFLALVTPAVRRLLRPGVARWTPGELATWKRRSRTGGDDPEPVVRGTSSSTAAAFFAALRAALPRDGIVVADSGLHQTLLRRHFDVFASRGLIVPTDFQSMGFGLAGAIGAAIAAPGRPVVAVVGDGGFAMSGLELLTAVREKVPVTVVVFADRALNRIRLDQLRRYGTSAHVDLLNPDFATFASSVGARYARCGGDAGSVLRDAIASRGVTLVEVPVGDSVAIHASRVGGLVGGTARHALGPGGVDLVRRALRRARPAGAGATGLPARSARALPPALLGDATWWGTLAAVRDLGSRGVAVTLASDARIAPARWSRHVTRTVGCPSNLEPARVLEWLLQFGCRTPGHVLYPTSDELAWLIAANREALFPYFRLYSPPVGALVCLLDKRCLGAAARDAGLCVPEAWCPASADEVTRISQEVRFPLYVKPRTQVFASLHGKGQMVGGPADLLAVWRKWRGRARYPSEVVERIPDVDLPLLQASVRRADRILTVDGFIDETGELFCTRGCLKVLQWPRGSGPGICFEAAPVPANLGEGLARLFRRVGFHGVFDAEFIEDDGRAQLIDVNPRFYNHMAFEVERGLPLPWLAYLGAIEDRAALRTAVAEAKREVGGPRSYVHRLPLRMMLGLQALTGAMSRDERHRWRNRMAGHEDRVTDPTRQEGDPWPGVVELPLELARFVAHPRSYLRHLTNPGPARTAATSPGP
jgi:thiamine pyrophosphate-dependent acetolactate synthase large subunit-like protein/predicted ATP-grasp superfamily ATP-dependent carboligase